MQAAGGVQTFQISLRDIFGDNGMIAVVVARQDGHVFDIDTWLMSCRVLGRGVEQATLNVLAARAHAAGAVELRGRYIPTPKNGIVRDHYKNLGFAPVSEDPDGTSVWSLALEGFVPYQTAIEIVETAAA